MTDAEQITAVVAEHGEGPCWDEHSGCLHWVDMFAGCVLSTNPATGETGKTRVAGPVAAFLRPIRDQTGFAVAGERDIQFLDAEGSKTLVALHLPDGFRCNEGGCDPQGRLYVGTMTYDCAPGRGSLLRINGQGEVELTLDQLTIPNGLAWSPEGTTAYFVDSATNRIDRFDFDLHDGRLHSRSPFAVIEQSDGTPDGLCVDAEGGVWVALVAGGTVRRYDTNGTLSAQVKVGCPTPTACAFGGPGLETLFITTTRYRGDWGPSDGALFACSPGISGARVDGFVAPAHDPA
jgi:sugar lactone lactonase YvrE